MMGKWLILIGMWFGLVSVGAEAAPSGEKPVSDPAVMTFKEWFATLPASEQQELETLREKDPEAFRKTLRERLPEPLRRRFDERQTILALAKRYQEADEVTRKQIRTELQERLTKSYFERMERNRRRLEDANRQLDELEKDFENRRKNADAIINAELERLLDPAEDKTAPEAAE